MENAILYCLLTHDGPKQTSRLVRSIYNERDCFVIHLDQSADPAYKAVVRGLEKDPSNFKIISTRTCSWGGFSLVNATIDMLKVGMGFETRWSHAVLLSATHLPLWPMGQVRDWPSKGQSIMQWDELPPEEPAWLAGLADRVEWDYEEKAGVGMQRLAKIGRPAFRYFKGSQWVVLARDHVRYIVQDGQNNIAERLSRSNVADESFFQTILLNSAYVQECVWGASTISVWTPAASSPKSLNFLEYQQLAFSEPKSPFVRKIKEELGDETAVDEFVAKWVH